MEEKDWIILLVPILCNGIIIFIFQKKVEKLLAKNEIKNRRKIRIMQQFWELILEVKYATVYLDSPKNSSEEAFKNAYIDLHDKVDELYQFYKTNNMLLKKYSKKISSAVCSVDNILNILLYKSKELKPEDFNESIHVELQQIKSSLDFIIKQLCR